MNDLTTLTELGPIARATVTPVMGSIEAGWQLLYAFDFSFSTYLLWVIIACGVIALADPKGLLSGTQGFMRSLLAMLGTIIAGYAAVPVVHGLEARAVPAHIRLQSQPEAAYLRELLLGCSQWRTTDRADGATDEHCTGGTHRGQALGPSAQRVIQLLAVKLAVQACIVPSDVTLALYCQNGQGKTHQTLIDFASTLAGMPACRAIDLPERPNFAAKWHAPELVVGYPSPYAIPVALVSQAEHFACDGVDRPLTASEVQAHLWRTLSAS